MNSRAKSLMAKAGKAYLLVNGAVFVGSFLVTVAGHYL